MKVEINSEDLNIILQILDIIDDVMRKYKK
jgi:hypothetical protein